MLLDIRRETRANVSINMLYEHPSLAGFSRQVDRQLGSTNGANGSGAGSKEKILRTLSFWTSFLSSRRPYQTADPVAIRASAEPAIFLTDAAGFLGAYLIKDILQQTSHAVGLIAHVRSAKDPKAALDRLQRSLQGYGLWHDEWSMRLSCIVGDLLKPQLSIEQHTWQTLSQEVNVVIHNGATVHWVRTYQDMMVSNVISMIDAMKLCNEGKPKLFTFVSFTSVLDTDHYVGLSEKPVSTGQNAIPEDDDMQGSRTGLGTGYGQTKWLSEQLVRAAGKRGLQGSVIRPGYILGDSGTGVCNTNDFLIRMLKGCIQLSARSRIINTVNAVPVSHVARAVVAAALNPLSISSLEASVTSRLIIINLLIIFLARTYFCSRPFAPHTRNRVVRVWLPRFSRWSGLGGSDLSRSGQTRGFDRC
jgi:L-aminoadipate-semialdehyde dehydrogenase